MIQDDHNREYKAIWKANEHKITFMINSTVVYKDVVAEYDSKVTRPEDPIHEGLYFDGWYADSAYTQPYDFNSVVKGDAVVYAKWRAPGSAPISENVGNAIANPKTGDNVYVYVIALITSVVAISIIVILKKKIRSK